MRKGQLVPIGQGRRRNDRWVDSKGYVFVRCDPTHPNARSKYGWIADHVLVMSELLGRPLRLVSRCITATSSRVITALAILSCGQAISRRVPEWPTCLPGVVGSSANTPKPRSGPPSLEVRSASMEQERLTSSLRVVGGDAGVVGPEDGIGGGSEA
jgi:hypothetical protein